MNLRPSGYEDDFTQPADGRRPSCFQSSRVVSSSAKSTEGHAGIRKSPPVWTRFGQSSGEPLRTGDLRLGNSEGLDSRTSTALHSEPKASISLETVAWPDPRIFHTHRRNTNLWVQRGSKTFCFCCSCGAAARSVHRHGLHAVRPWTTATRSHLERYPHRADGPESLRGCSTCSNARQVTGRVDLPRRFKAWAGFELATVAAFAESWRARRNQGNCSVHRRLNQRTPQVRILNVIRVVREDLAAFIVARPEHG